MDANTNSQNELAQEPKIDLFFPIQGVKIPLDHGYALYSALSRVLESEMNQWLHGTNQLGIHPIRGEYLDRGFLKLAQYSRLGIRLPTSWVSKMLALSGAEIEISGHALTVGHAITKRLTPSSVLYAHRVTTKNGQDENRFDREISAKLKMLEVLGRAQRGTRRVLKIQGKTIIAHSLLISELTADESIRLQEVGLGGRRKMGCGVFVPWKN